MFAFTTSMREKLINILSQRQMSIAIILLAIGARIALQVYFFDISGDRSFQLVAAKSFVEGHGFAIPQVLPDNPTHQIYRPLVGWPPGYSLFISPLYFLCNKNIIAAAFFFEILCAVLFIIVLRKILLLLNTPLWLVNIHTILTGFFIYDFTKRSTSDFSSLTFFLLAIYFLLVFIKRTKRPPFGIFIGLLLFLCAVMRYMYAPIVLPAAFYLLWTGYSERIKILITGGCYCVLTLFFLLACLYFYQYNFTGSAVYITPSEKGFYPSNLLHIAPVLFSPFLNIEVLAIALNSLFGFGYGRQIELIGYIHLLPFAVLLIGCVVYLLRRIKNNRSLTGHYLYLGLLCSVSTVFLLLFLSVRNAPILNLGYPWTFVEDARYYAFLIVFIHQLLFLFLRNCSKKTNGILKAIALSLAILLGLQTVHGFYFVAKKLIYETSDFTARKNDEATDKFFYTSLDRLQQSHPAKTIITISNDPTFQNLAALKGHSASYETSFINDPSKLKAGNVMLLVVLRHEVLNQYSGFLQLANTRLIGSVGSYNFYTFET
jgi:hypothetical protein